MPTPMRLAVLGSTGSIGRQVLDVVSRNPERFSIVALSTNSQVELLARQAAVTSARLVAIADSQAASAYRPASSERVLTGMGGLLELCALEDADMVVNALVGSVGLRPTLAALNNGKRLGLSNKESLVAGGDLVLKAATTSGAAIIPIDSEHSAIFQCLDGRATADVRSIIITASGGPFRGMTRHELADVTVEAALAHPRWEMGQKITIDSATLMNKGLEVIEAHYLFGMPYRAIKVVVHPQSIIHSMVEFTDGGVLAQLGATDMRLPIQYALTHPERLPSPVARLDMTHLTDLTFGAPDTKTFPCLRYCYEAGEAGGTAPAVLSAANEEAVRAFLAAEIGFLGIADTCRAVLDAHDRRDADGVETLDEIGRAHV